MSRSRVIAELSEAACVLALDSMRDNRCRCGSFYYPGILRARRLLAGLSQKAVAQKTGLPVHEVANCEVATNGARGQTLTRLAAFYGLSRNHATSEEFRRLCARPVWPPWTEHEWGQRFVRRRRK